MKSRFSIIVGVVALVVGFAGGFALKPVIAPPVTRVPMAMIPPATTAAETRGAQYFVAHVEEARQVVAACRDGAVRGDECANAEMAIIKVEAAERQKRFLGQ